MKRRRRKYAACLRRIDALERALFPEWFHEASDLYGFSRSIERVAFYGGAKSPYTFV